MLAGHHVGRLIEIGFWETSLYGGMHAARNTTDERIKTMYPNMKKGALFFVSAAGLLGCAGQPVSTGDEVVSQKATTTREVRQKEEALDEKEALARSEHATLGPMVEVAKKKVETFFGRPFEHEFELVVLPDRAALDAHWQETWSMPDFKSQCWMVASGTETELVILAPEVWKEQACEHDPTNRVKLQNLITHEVTHVFHDQHNPREAMEGLSSISWFVEGLAVHVSGQLDEEGRPNAREAIEDDASSVPQHLEDAWSGKYRYSIAGSMVKFVDEEISHDVVLDMLGATSEQELLEAMGENITEEKFLKTWKTYVFSSTYAPL